MATRNVTVGTTSTLFPGSNPNGFRDDVAVINTGSATAYLDTDQQPGTTSGQPLSAGSSVVWQKGQPLWVVAPSVTTLSVTTNSGALFDAGAVAAQLNAQGLPGLIAAAINVSGVPAIDQGVLLQSGTTTISGAFTSILTGGVSLDVTRYSSLVFNFEVQTVGPAASPAGFVTGYVYHRDASGNALHIEGFHALDDNNVLASGNVNRYRSRIACLGAQFDVKASYSGAVSTLKYWVYGSYRPASPTIRQQGHGYWGASGTGTVDGDGTDGRSRWTVGSQPNLAAWTEWPITYGGVRSQLLFDSVSVVAAGNVQALVLDATTTDVIAGKTYVGAGLRIIDGTVEFWMPNRPASLYVKNATGGALDPGAKVTLLQQLPS